MESYDRRALLGAAGRLAAGAALAPSLRWTGLLAGGDPRLAELARLVDGPVLTRGKPGYAAAKRLQNTRFDAVSPLAIAQCVHLRDVERVVSWARRHGIRIAARSGGHSYGGYSTTPGVVADVSRLSGISVDAAGKTALIGAGVRLIDVYTALWQRRVAIPGGSCPTVGIAGLTQGGGIGFSSRKFGLTCDNVMGATVVIAAGRAVACSASRHSDLLWALRGGGGGNFGIVTSFHFGVHPVGDVTTFTVRWPWADAARAVAAWQDWAPHAPDALWSTFGLFAGGGGAPTISAAGQFFGTKAELTSVLAPLLAAAPPSSTSLVTRSFLEAQVLWAGGCHGPATNCDGRSTFAAKSDYAVRPLTPRAIATLVHRLAARAADSTPGRGYVLLDSYGGAINRVPPRATAFVHRGALFSFQYQATWSPGDKATVAAANIRWLRRLHTAMRPFVSGGAYVNYIDPDLAKPGRAYYGANLQRLRRVKRAYDAGNFFRFHGSIAPA